MTQLLQPIPSTAGLYAADATGQIWRVKGPMTPRPRKVKPYTGRAGYRTVPLSIKGLKFRCSVHRLVAEAFHGKCPEGFEVCHANHVRDDNRPENLRYGTHSENVCESQRDGRYFTHDNNRRKVKKHQWLEIVARYAAGATQTDIAAEYGVSVCLISRTITKRFPR